MGSRADRENLLIDDVLHDTIRFLEARGQAHLARDYVSFLAGRFGSPAEALADPPPGPNLAQRFADRLCLESLAAVNQTTAGQEDVTLELLLSAEDALQTELLVLVRTSRERRALIDLRETGDGWSWQVSTETITRSYRGLYQLIRALRAEVRAPELIANEATALWNLQFLTSAQTTYQALYDTAGFAALAELGKVSLVDTELSCGLKHGYRFEATPAADDLFIHATPTKYGASGRRSFAMGVHRRSVCVDDCAGLPISFDSPSLRIFNPRLRLSLWQQT